MPMQDEFSKLTPEQKNKFIRAANIMADDQDAIIQELNLLDEKIDKVAGELDNKVTEALTIALETQKMEGAMGEKGDKGDRGEKGDKGDKGDKGNTTIVEKIIEKTEVIKERPIITEVTNNVENPFILEGQDIVDKVNELPTDDDEYKIDASHIKNLQKYGGQTRVTSLVEKNNPDITLVTIDVDTTITDSGLYIVRQPVTVTLPKILPDAKKISISNQSSGEVTILASSGDLVHDDTSMIMRYTNSTAQLVSSSLGWVVI